MVDAVKILGALLGGGNMASGSGANILKSVLGSALGGGTAGQGGGTAGQGGGLGDLLGGVLQDDGSQGGLGGMLGSVLGKGGSSGGGLGEMLGDALGGGGNQPATGASLEDLLGGVLGGKPQGASGDEGADLSELIGSALSQFGQAEKAAQQGATPVDFESNTSGVSTDKVQNQAEIMIRAMINAAKSDGRVDKEEQEKILGKLGSLTRDEVDFINREIASPLDVDEFARSVPPDMKNQAYAMSLMAIDLDNNAEAGYLRQLGQSLGMHTEAVNQVHGQLGAPHLYS